MEESLGFTEKQNWIKCCLVRLGNRYCGAIARSIGRVKKRPEIRIKIATVVRTERLSESI